MQESKVNCSSEIGTDTFSTRTKSVYSNAGILAKCRLTRFRREATLRVHIWTPAERDFDTDSGSGGEVRTEGGKKVAVEICYRPKWSTTTSVVTQTTQHTDVLRQVPAHLRQKCPTLEGITEDQEKDGVKHLQRQPCDTVDGDVDGQIEDNTGKYDFAGV
ncbi:hypothetical protein B0H17DRAFT_1151574 [Mycena rosella]|uniref:Uncharacterized protein n=1 Tax=Mycena rosella TaxID=1033263 RepID=A0AAD7BJ81_MYCRO|nr:hypothetical protein B0H17DRAFT_1151574 [Mycena rosella]